MTHLGDLGNPSANGPISFDYFGQTIAARHGLSDLHYLDFIESAAGLAPDDPRSLRFVKEFARACISEDDFERFWTLALENGQRQTDVHDVLLAVIEGATGRPTDLPSDSSDGQPSTSTGDSSSPEALLPGRPDLQLVVKRAQEAIAS